MNRRLLPAMVVTAMLAGCSLPSLSKDSTVVQTNQSKNKEETTIIPSMQIDDQYYRTLLPYKESASRGLIVSNINTKYDVKEAESGLLRLSQQAFDPSKYYFQEGQYLDKDTVTSWLSRSNQDPAGLNPRTTKNMTPTERAKNAPIYLAHIVEQNYLQETGKNKVKLAGISIGLALNSVYYYQKEQYGATYEEDIPQSKLETEGKKIAKQVVKRLRQIDGLAEVPITIGLFKQLSRSSIVPGTYFAYTDVDQGSATIKDWKNINEKYVLFPTSDTNNQYRDINENFTNFKHDIDKYFSNYTNIVGTGFYQNNKIQKLKIEIPIKFYGTSEIIGFTQYMSGEVMDQFPKGLQIEVNVTSVNGPEALVVKEANSNEPYVHIYNK
ncbi:MULTISPECIES: CamS family sex pheromone protein [unclassified Rummeliibacillus]|uniref:CamS family sex pheromone protein n=1 Tax=unclassified Rummeliibacillus TaxID=2622809 RepID=UPI000E666C2C|nr:MULTISPECIES: CamS family sex pheromone protein [unclassified Rummeliibacillus]RIJ68796.1 CamS family sex pheromone protein [Rummeliibacillus sp. POC4]RPJ94520.1 CamS family sex pheromone protein [Rummeliibacillus sp. TYF005]